MEFGVTEREVVKKGEKKGKGVERKFLLRIVCQNHILVPAYCKFMKIPI